MDIVYDGEVIKVTGERIDIALTFECAQAFRFQKTENGAYLGVAGKKPVFVRQNGEGMDLYPVEREAFQHFWYDYFDLGLNYQNILALFRQDPILNRAVEEFPGLRLLNQQPFETLITFIISSNNNEKRIRGIVERLCEAAGEPIMCGERRFFAFPEPEALAALPLSRLQALGAGYRAEYIKRTAAEVARGFALDRLFNMEYREAKKELCLLMGVGPKVADCVLLFALKKKNAFPIDTWMRKVLTSLYGFSPKSDAEAMDFAQTRFGGYAGIAQQYLFHYARMHRI